MDTEQIRARLASFHACGRTSYATCEACTQSGICQGPDGLAEDVAALLVEVERVEYERREALRAIGDCHLLLQGAARRLALFSAEAGLEAAPGWRLFSSPPSCAFYSVAGGLTTV